MSEDDPNVELITSFVASLPGEQAQEFKDDYNFYAREVNSLCPQIFDEIVEQAREQFPLVMKFFFAACNQGYVDIEAWSELSPPVIKSKIKTAIDKIRRFSEKVEPNGNAGTSVRRDIPKKPEKFHL